MQIEQFNYDNRIVKNFAYATMLWGFVGMLVGVIIAFQLYSPALNLKLPYTTFGRLRPLHTNAVIFAFVGNGIFMGVYYSLQRLLKARLFNDTLSKIHFWGWQLIIVLAALTLVMGYTTGKEYAELEWPIDILIALIWVVFGINMFGTIFKRREKHLYVGIWFYIATFVTITMLHVVNSIEIPVSLTKSYSWYAGVQDALVQWWYGHNAVAFFLTTPYLGVMYYFLPKAANRPVYSYRLSIVHFWSLIFLYIWAGPHHLLYTSLPDWAQSLGTVFSVMLIAPSWGGMFNGLLTLRGAWDKVREDAILKFMVVAVTAYGMSTFEGPLLSLKNVNAISHFTDWTVAHVHVGALGWNGFMTFAMLYWLIPRLFKTEIYSKSLMNTHFWLGTLGILLYAIPMYWAGFSQSLSWSEFTPDGTLRYTFMDTVVRIKMLYLLRGLGGTIYLSGFVVMLYNLMKTVKSGSLLANEPASAPALVNDKSAHEGEYWHRWIERRPVQFMLLSLVMVLIGGVIEFVPTFLVKSNIPTIASVKPYTPLELEGRDIYIREGCYNCHSQMIRPFRHETERYGEYSKAGEFVYDHPFQWGSKRTGPDLHRQGGRNPDSWHFKHMYEPSWITTGSIMPAYPWLFHNDIDKEGTPGKIRAMQTLGVPYANQYDMQSVNDLNVQAKGIVANLQADDDVKKMIESEDIKNLESKEIIALIAYLQRLGTDIKNTGVTAK
jgi:cytochrome c oxidase cbb3-type subunit I/II